MVRVTRPGGLIAAYVWDYAGRMDFLRVFWDAAAALDPAARNQDEGRRLAAFGPSGLGRLFAEVGLIGVEVEPVDVGTTFGSFEEFWVPFLGGQGPAPASVAGLSSGGRAALRERLRRTLPARPDGSISLLARAWAVRGRRPAMS